MGAHLLDPPLILYTVYDLDISPFFPFSRGDPPLPLIMVLPRPTVILSDSETGGQSICQIMRFEHGRKSNNLINTKTSHSASKFRSF